VNAVAARAVTIAVGRRALVDGVDLAVEAGTWVTVIGPNGAGKTTLVEALVGARALTSGSVAVMGLDVARAPERRRARVVAFVPQRPATPAGMTVADYVGLGLVARVGAMRALSVANRSLVAETIERVGLAPESTRDVSTLSGGERQRAVIARAVAQATPVVILDEPTTGLDVRHQIDALDLLRREVTERGLTVLATLHDLTLAGQYADEVVLLHRGRVSTTGPAHDVLRSSLLADAYGIEMRVVEVDGRDVVVPRRA